MYERVNATYVYYEYHRVYDPKRKYTIVKRSTIGKLSEEDPNQMHPNENFRKYFPEVEAPEEHDDSGRSSALKAGSYMVIHQVVKDLGLDHAVTKTQKEILSAFGIEASHVKYKAAYISQVLQEGTK